MGELEGCCCSILKFSYYLVTTMNPRVVKTISYMQRGQDNATRTAPNTDLWQCRKPGRRAAAPFICLAANRHNSRRVGLDGMALGSATAPATDNTVVTAQLLHVPRARTGSEWFYYMKDVPEGKSRTNLRFEQLEVSITDLRSSSELPTLSLNGFQLEHLSSPQKIDWQDESQIRSLFYPEVEAVLKKASGASKVVLFDHTLRKGSVPIEAWDPSSGKLPGLGGAPSNRAHCDYTANSGINRLKQLLPEDAEQMQQSSYAIMQVWRPLRGPVQNSPLALCDASSVPARDLQTNLLHFPTRTGEVNLLAHNPEHRWYYASDMQTDEMYVWVGYDSRPNRPSFVPHSSFHNPNAPADAPDRESIELRAYVFWES